MSIQLTLQLVSLHIQGLTDVPIQMSTVDGCCKLSEFDMHSQAPDIEMEHVHNNIMYIILYSNYCFDTYVNH